MNHSVATRISAIGQAVLPFMEFIQDSSWFEASSNPEVNNFAFGDPQEMPLEPFVGALRREAEPQNASWFAYKLSEPESQQVVAGALQQELGIPFEPEDIAMTNGAFAALTIALQVVVDPGDEVIINLPPWFFYEGMIAHAGGVPVKVPVDRQTFDLDLAAIEAAITPQTRAIIINTPNNPTGRIYPPEMLERLAAILFRASERHGRPIYLISDEPYRRLRFDNEPFATPLAYYPYSMMTYSYGKVLLTPGQRIGYLALPPTMPEREQIRAAIQAVQFTGGFLFPNAVMQYALADLETMSIDMGELTRKRDRMVDALREIGYEVHVPQGTFYLMPRSPWSDDRAFLRVLLDHNVLCLPGKAVDFPGFFRISLTANDEVIERSLPAFAAAFEHAQTHTAPNAGLVDSLAP